MQPIRIGDEGTLATRALLRRLDTLGPGADPGLRRTLQAFESLDRRYGGSAPLALEDAPELVDAALARLAQLDEAARREARAAERDAVTDLTLGVALWALRHEVALGVVEPVVNALALRSNAAAGKAELAAVFGLMQGVIANVAPRLAPDLERSNPERPWRILHANLAITAIRTEDPALMDHAFDALQAALPEESGNFFAEALALAMNPRVAPAVRERIEARQGKGGGFLT